jgi:serine palmitoyltransferase
VPTGDEPRAAPHDFVISEYVPGGRQVLVKIAGPDARTKVTWCSQDFVANGVAPEVRAVAADTLEAYTVGSCGPRGFYGTSRPHLELEDTLAAFMGTSESITYSDSTATTSSAIPAFAKRGDVLLVDSGASFSVQLGARLSRSKTVYFRHNDMSDLARHLQRVRTQDEQVVDDSLLQRRFIVVEGLYSHYGDLCPLPEVLRLAREYQWRVILDDSCGIGALGATGRGIVEHYGLSTADVDVLIGSMATSLASVGGFCVGSREVVDHQRLSGAGYCYSASAPPFTCAVATASLRRMLQAPALLSALRDRSVALHHALAARVPGFAVTSDPISPIKHLLLTVGPAAHYPRTITWDVLASGSGGGGGGSSGGGGSGSGGSGLGLATAASAAASERARPAAADGDGGRTRSAGAASSRAANRVPLPSPTPLATTPGSLLDLRREEEAVLRSVVAAAAGHGVLLPRSHFLDSECTAPRPTLKVFVTLAHTEAECEALLQALSVAAAAVLGLGVPGGGAKGPVVGGAYRDRVPSAATAGLLSPAAAPRTAGSPAGKRSSSKGRAAALGSGTGL